MLRNRTFKQERSEKTYEAILHAAARVFPREGFEGTQTPDIAKEAGVSTGAVYRYFRDKRQIFLEMLELRMAQAQGEIEARLAAVAALDMGSDPAAAVGLLIDTLFEQAKKDAALTRVYVALSFTDPDVAALRTRAEAKDRAVLAALIEGGIARTRVPSPAATALLVQVAAVSVATELALRKSRTPSDADVKAALRDMLVAFFFPAASGDKNGARARKLPTKRR